LTSAKVQGDANPSSLEAVLTTYKQALDETGGGEPVSKPADASVYLLYAVGNFTGAGEKIPAGSEPTPGTDLGIIVDASTLAVSEISLTNDAMDLSTLGTVIKL
jgi:hypothetical protein